MNRFNDVTSFVYNVPTTTNDSIIADFRPIPESARKPVTLAQLSIAAILVVGGILCMEPVKS